MTYPHTDHISAYYNHLSRKYRSMGWTAKANEAASTAAAYYFGR